MKTEVTPNYYALPNGLQVFDFIRYMDFNCGCAVKYLWRNGRKQELGMTDKEKAVQDLNKAIDYIVDEIENILGGECKYGLKKKES